MSKCQEKFIMPFGPEAGTLHECQLDDSHSGFHIAKCGCEWGYEPA